MTKKISQLPAATSVDTNDEFVINQDGTTKKLTTANQWDFDNVNIDGGSITGITDLAVADGGTGASDASGARTNLDLGTMATQNNNSVDIDGGTIDSTAVNATTLTASGDVNFDSGTLFVDASADAVGIGVTAPAVMLDVEKNSSVALSGTGRRVAKITSTSDAVTDKPGVIFGYDTAGAGIIASATQALGQPLAFWTYNGSSWGERMRIDSSGNVLIGATSPANNADLTVGPFIGFSSYSGGNNNPVDTISVSAGNGGALVMITGVDFNTGASFSRLHLVAVRVAGGTASTSTTISQTGALGITFSFSEASNKLRVTPSGLVSGNFKILIMNS